MTDEEFLEEGGHPAELSEANNEAQRKLIASLRNAIKECRRMLAVHRKEAKGRCTCWTCVDVRHLIYTVANADNMLECNTRMHYSDESLVEEVPAKVEPAPAPPVKFREFF